MSDTEDSGKELPEWLLSMFYLGAIAVIFSVCAGVPFVVSAYTNNWIALVAALVGVVCWVYMVKPMPGFVQGIVSLNGLAALVGLSMYWIVRAL